MNTRSIIKLMGYTGEILLYKPQGGYPDTKNGIIKFLQPYFNGNGNVQLMATKLILKTNCETSTGFHTNIAFYYEVNVMTRTISVFQVDVITGKHTFLKTVKAIEVIN